MLFTIMPSETCDLALMRRYSRTAWRLVDAYHRGLGGVLANYAVRKSKSHRCVTDALDREVNQLAVERKAEKKWRLARQPTTAHRLCWLRSLT